eukprot:scaffold4958_cov406-Prasinococcus_capsulatus_cf.AAC.9
MFVLHLSGGLYSFAGSTLCWTATGTKLNFTSRSPAPGEKGSPQRGAGPKVSKEQPQNGAYPSMSCRLLYVLRSEGRTVRFRLPHSAAQMAGQGRYSIRTHDFSREVRFGPCQAPTHNVRHPSARLPLRARSLSQASNEGAGPLRSMASVFSAGRGP